jgi:hypothetical protein
MGAQLAWDELEKACKEDRRLREQPLEKEAPSWVARQTK